MILGTPSGRIAFMANDELLSRIDRIYASVDANQEFDMTKLPGIVWQQQSVVWLYQDFRSGLSQPEIQNIAHSLIHNIANLKGHLRRWARQNGTDPATIDQAIGPAMLSISSSTFPTTTSTDIHLEMMGIQVSLPRYPASIE